MAPAPRVVAQPRPRQAEAEVRVVRDRIGLDDGREALGGELVRADVEVRLSQRLEDRGLSGLEGQRALEEDGGRAGVALGQHA